MWLAQFVCAPQFLKTPKGLCGHTVHLLGRIKESEIKTSKKTPSGLRTEPVIYLSKKGAVIITI
jgi:hypothetical protein